MLCPLCGKTLDVCDCDDEDDEVIFTEEKQEVEDVRVVRARLKKMRATP